MEKFFVLIEYALFNVVAGIVKKIFKGESDFYQKTIQHGKRLRQAVHGAVDSAAADCCEDDRKKNYFCIGRGLFWRWQKC